MDIVGGTLIDYFISGASLLDINESAARDYCFGGIMRVK